MLPEIKLDQDELDKVHSLYTDLIGEVPKGVAARIDLLARLDTDLLAVQEELRKQVMYKRSLDDKAVQLTLFGMLLMAYPEAARFHAVAARRAGATWEELNDIVAFAYLAKGLPGAHLGAKVLQEVARNEQNDGS